MTRLFYIGVQVFSESIERVLIARDPRENPSLYRRVIGGVQREALTRGHHSSHACGEHRERVTVKHAEEFEVAGLDCFNRAVRVFYFAFGEVMQLKAGPGFPPRMRSVIHC